MFFHRVEAAPKKDRNGVIFSIAELMWVLAAWVLLRCLERRDFKPSEALAELPVLRERGLKRANVLGDTLGHRGYKLYRSGPKILGDYDNASLVLQHQQDHEGLAAKLGFANVRQLHLAVLQLRWREMDLDEQRQIAEEMGFADVADLEQAFSSLPQPSLTVDDSEASDLTEESSLED